MMRVCSDNVTCIEEEHLLNRRSEFVIVSKGVKQKGYKTYLYFICIDDPEVNVSRVENR